MLMTHLAKFALLVTVALLAAVGCQREPAVDNPNFNAEDNSVTTQLVLSISTQTSQDQQTKQDPGVAQTGTSPKFRGINEAFLLPIIQDTDGQILPGGMAAASVIDLSEVLNSSGSLLTHSSRIMEVQLPLKTNTLLFYAKAPMGTVGTDDDAYNMETDYKGMNIWDIYGKLDNYYIGKNKGSANFRLGVRMANTTADPTLVERFNAVETTFSSLMTCLLNFGLYTAQGTHEALTAAIYGYAFNATPAAYNASTTPYSYPEFRWKDYVNTTGTSPVDPSHALYSLENKLATLYKQLTSINATAGELRAASGEANLRMIQDLWTVINEIRCATPASPAEAVAKYFATQLDDRLTSFFNYTKRSDDGSAIEGVSYKNTGTILTLLKAHVDDMWPVEDATTVDPAHTTSKPSSDDIDAITALIGTDNTILTNFPHNFNLPRGASHVAFDKNYLVYSYPTVFNTSGMGTAGSYGATNYYYPSELLYYGNSPIRVNDKDKRASEYPLANAWMTDEWTGWDSGTNGYVKSTTRAVAMQNEINYGSALLETKVGYSVGVLQDHRHYVMKTFAGTSSAITDDKDASGKYVDEPNNEITVTDDLFTLTGIIIGGQSQNVGWNYLPYYEVDGDDNLTTNMVYGFVYDRAIDVAARAIPANTASTSSPNYTILFDNCEWTSEDATTGLFTPKTVQTPVSIALEFRNNGEDFYGNYNLVRKGGYFYLIGTLDPATGTGEIDWNRDGAGKDGHVIPPYKIESGKVVSTETKRVFIQDHKTSVTFRFNTYSLQHAYLTVPDLRSSSLSLGLDVDLNWESGLTFSDITLGGNEVN